MHITTDCLHVTSTMKYERREICMGFTVACFRLTIVNAPTDLPLIYFISYMHYNHDNGRFYARDVKVVLRRLHRLVKKKKNGHLYARDIKVIPLLCAAYYLLRLKRGNGGLPCSPNGFICEYDISSQLNVGLGTRASPFTQNVIGSRNCPFVIMETRTMTSIFIDVLSSLWL